MVRERVMTQIWRRWVKTLIGLLALLSTGMIIAPLQDKLVAQTGENDGNTSLEGLEQGAGQGIVLAVLGGFRTLMADILWLQTMQAWEKEDLNKTLSLIQFTTTVDPEPKFFWLNGARIIANDMPHWDASQGRTPEETHQKMQALAQAAISFLQNALLQHPEKPDWLMEIGHIHLNKLKDPVTATHFYKRAYLEFETAPYYIARLHAQLLQRVGRDQEAYEFLTWLHSTLPDDPYAQSGVVLGRIRKLERRLGIPVKETYRSRDVTQ